MMKNNKWKLLISSVLILLPIFFGLIFWKELPEQMAVHWGIDGRADGFGSGFSGVFIVPVLVLITHWFCIFCTVKDPKNKNQNSKVFSMVLWICPAVSLFASGIIYAAAFGAQPRADLFVLPFLGFLFVVIGNYLPKCRQNYTIGIKVKWTLENEENWNATHRVGGKIWAVGGFLMMICTFLPEAFIPWALVISIVLLGALPVLYSYMYHRKQVREGTAVITPILKNKGSKAVAFITIGVVLAILVFVGIITFTGDIEVKYGETSFTVEASFWSDLTVEYDAVDSIEYRDEDDRGARTNGLGSARLLAGAFRNSEFGNYTRYSYTACDACVVLSVGDKTLVISGSDQRETKNIYDELMERM